MNASSLDPQLRLAEIAKPDISFRISFDQHRSLVLCRQRGHAGAIRCRGTAGGWLAVVMEYLETDLYSVLAAWHEDQRSSFKTSVSKAVEVLHGGGFVHGDIRNANS
jgi:hypothetical protein